MSPAVEVRADRGYYDSDFFTSICILLGLGEGKLVYVRGDLGIGHG